jgi:hypothetical protein
MGGPMETATMAAATTTTDLEALERVRSGSSLSNWPAIFAGFEAKGIPASEIEPRVNVLTYRAWRAAGRQVRKGEHGVKIVTWITKSKRDDKTGKTEDVRFPRTATVFHVSQTDPIE